jgi:hypothetical protein
MLERHPQHVQAIGMISIEIANLDIALADLLASLLHIDRHFGRVVYLTPQTFMGRLKILQNVTDDHVEADTEGHRYLVSVISRARKLIGKRHEYIHNVWGTSPTLPDQVVRQALPQRQPHPALPVPLEELTDMIEDIRELTQDINHTVNESFAAWPPYSWQGTNPPPTGIEERPKERGKGEK